MRKSSSSRLRLSVMRLCSWSKAASTSLSRRRSRACCSSSVMKWYSWRVTFCRKTSSLALRFKDTVRASAILGLLEEDGMGPSLAIGSRGIVLIRPESEPSSKCAASRRALGSPPGPAPAALPPWRQYSLASGLCASRALPYAHEGEVELPALEVDARELHDDLVSETVDLSRVLALEQVGLLVEPVVVVAHRGNVHEPLNVDLLELHEEPKRLDAGHISRAGLPQLVRHEADLLPLHELALRVRC